MTTYISVSYSVLLLSNINLFFSMIGSDFSILRTVVPPCCFHLPNTCLSMLLLLHMFELLNYKSVIIYSIKNGYTAACFSEVIVKECWKSAGRKWKPCKIQTSGNNSIRERKYPCSCWPSSRSRMGLSPSTRTMVTVVGTDYDNLSS